MSTETLNEILSSAVVLVIFTVMMIGYVYIGLILLKTRGKVKKAFRDQEHLKWLQDEISHNNEWFILSDKKVSLVFHRFQMMVLPTHNREKHENIADFRNRLKLNPPIFRLSKSRKAEFKSNVLHLNKE